MALVMSNSGFHVSEKNLKCKLTDVSLVRPPPWPALPASGRHACDDDILSILDTQLRPTRTDRWREILFWLGSIYFNPRALIDSIAYHKHMADCYSGRLEIYRCQVCVTLKCTFNWHEKHTSNHCITMCANVCSIHFMQFFCWCDVRLEMMK